MCAPISNASLERLFNQMNIVKSNVRNHLTNSTLNALLHIKVSNFPLDFIHKITFQGVLNTGSKRRPGNGARKTQRYHYRKSKISKRLNFDFSTMPSSSSSGNSESDIDSEVEHV